MILALAIAGGVVGYAYIGYPLLLRFVARRSPGPPPRTFTTWPSLSITLPVHNGAATLAAVLDAILANDYPGPRQILVISDGSTDGTVAITRTYAAQGVELCELPERVGKTEAENRALPLLRGEIIVNTDASVRWHPAALRPLVAALADPTVGVASSCDRSVDLSTDSAQGEAVYVDLEMRLRDLETAAGGIVGASGCLYAIRAELHRRVLRGHLSRDFAAPLHARERGFRTVSVPAAICLVPRGRGQRHEYQRKVRTMARGLATLADHRRLLDPFRYGRFAWMLISHKLVRWLTPFALALVGVLFLVGPFAPWNYLLVATGLGVAALGWWWPGARPPRLVALPAYAVAGVVAGLHAWWRALTGGAAAVWEPTRRVVTTPGGDRS